MVPGGKDAVWAILGIVGGPLYVSRGSHSVQVSQRPEEISVQVFCLQDHPESDQEFTLLDGLGQTIIGALFNRFLLLSHLVRGAEDHHGDIACPFLGFGLP